MSEIEPQTAGGKVLWHFTMSLDGFVAGPDHGMDWMAGTSVQPGLIQEYAETTGAILGGRDGWDHYPDPSAVYGGAVHPTAEGHAAMADAALAAARQVLGLASQTAVVGEPLAPPNPVPQ